MRGTSLRCCGASPPPRRLRRPVPRPRRVRGPRDVPARARPGHRGGVPRPRAERVHDPSRRGVEILHSLASTGPALAPGLRSVVTLHDVTFFRLRTFGRATTLALKANV